MTQKVQTYREHPLSVFGRPVHKVLCQDSSRDPDSPDLYEVYMFEPLPAIAACEDQDIDIFALQAAE